MKHRKATAVARKHNYYGDSGRSMGLILSNGHTAAGGAGSKGFSVKTIGRVLFPLSTTPASRRRKLSSAVRSVVADLKK